MSGAEATLKRKREEDPRAEQLATIFSMPCTLFWSDGSQSETTLGQAFSTEEDYNRYRKYKRSGKAYPVKVEAVEPANPKAPSRVFPQGTVQEEYGVLKTMCKGFTEALQQFVEGA